MVNAARKKEIEAREMVAKKKSVAKAAAAAEKQKKEKRGKKAAEKTETGVKRNLGAMVDEVDRSNVQTPPFRYDIHIVNNQLAIEVQLHKVNPKAIDVAATTDKTLIIDTTKGVGRKFHLEFDFPEKMVCDSAKAEYEFENGLLVCKFPVTKMPKAVVADRAKFIDKVTADKKKRFKVREEQGLTIRSREAEMTKVADAMEAAAPKAVKADSSDEVPAKKMKTEADVDAEVAALQAAHKAGKLTKPKAEKPGVSSQSANPKKQFVGDDAALQMAVSAGQQVKQTLQQRMKLARELQQSRLVRTQHRDDKKSTKQDKKEAAYERILNEKRTELAKKTQMLAKPKKAAQSNAKSVKFA